MKSHKPAAQTEPAPRKKAPGRNGFKYRPQFGVIVVCSDEADQQTSYRALLGLGYKLKVVCV
jgi:hypothetical protein